MQPARTAALIDAIATKRFLTPRISPFAFVPSAATTFIALMPRLRNAMNTSSREEAFMESSWRTPSDVLYAYVYFTAQS
jgi:hypothetical protein